MSDGDVLSWLVLVSEAFDHLRVSEQNLDLVPNENLNINDNQCGGNPHHECAFVFYSWLPERMLADDC